MKEISHGLLVEDFKTCLYKLITEHTLDIQSKNLVLQLISYELKEASQTQTTKEYNEYKKDNEKNKDIVSGEET